MRNVPKMAVLCFSAIGVSVCLTVCQAFVLGISSYISNAFVIYGNCDGETVGKLNILNKGFTILERQRVFVYRLLQ